MADLEALQLILKSVEEGTRKQVIKEIQAFANEYHHHIDGQDVVIVDQLLEFLTPVNE